MQLQREAMYILIACTWVKIPSQNIIGIKGMYHFSLLKNEFQKPKKLKESP